MTTEKVIVNLNKEEMNANDYKNVVSKMYYNYIKNNKCNQDGNIRIFNLSKLKKYMCFDTDDKKSNDYVSSIMKKYGIKNNCYPSISNYYKHDEGENSYKHHYWFETDKPITSHISINNTLLDVWGPNGSYTNIDGKKHKWDQERFQESVNDDSSRIIIEPNIEGLYLDTHKKYPILTNEIYHDIMNINLSRGFYSNKKIPSCDFHDDCIAFEIMKHTQNCYLDRKTNNSRDKSTKILNVDVCKDEWKDSIAKKFHYYKNNNKPNDENGNTLVFNLQDKKKYVCVDTDSKKANDHVLSIMNKYNIQDNCYPSVSNYFHPNVEENCYKYHYWFEIVNPVGEHILINDALLDVWASDGSCRLIFEPNVTGMCFDACKKYPMFTDEIYSDILNIHSKKGFIFTKEQANSCRRHDDCNDFVRFKREEKNGFRRDGYNPMSRYHKELLEKYLTRKNPNSYALVYDDKSYGVICCVKTNDHNDPIIATIRMCIEPSYLSLPKGHAEKSESDIDCAIRETREEIGIDASKYIDPKLYTTEKYTIAHPMHDSMWKMHKDYPNESKRPFCVYYKEVKYFLAIFPEIMELKPQPEEILECKWVLLSKLKKEMHTESSKVLTNFIESKNVKSKLNNPQCKNSSVYVKPWTNPFKLFEKSQPQPQPQSELRPNNYDVANKRGLFSFFKKK